MIPEPGKRKRDQTEEEPRGVPSRSLRRTKPAQESTAPRVGEKGPEASWEMEMWEDGEILGDWGDGCQWHWLP